MEQLLHRSHNSNSLFDFDLADTIFVLGVFISNNVTFCPLVFIFLWLIHRVNMLSTNLYICIHEFVYVCIWNCPLNKEIVYSWRMNLKLQNQRKFALYLSFKHIQWNMHRKSRSEMFHKNYALIHTHTTHAHTITFIFAWVSSFESHNNSNNHHKMRAHTVREQREQHFPTWLEQIYNVMWTKWASYFATASFGAYVCMCLNLFLSLVCASFFFILNTLWTSVYVSC